MTVFSIFTLQKFTNFHAIRSWSFHNIYNEIGWPRFLRHPVVCSACCNHGTYRRRLRLDTMELAWLIRLMKTVRLMRQTFSSLTERQFWTSSRRCASLWATIVTRSRSRASALWLQEAAARWRMCDHIVDWSQGKTFKGIKQMMKNKPTSCCYNRVDLTITCARYST